MSNYGIGHKTKREDVRINQGATWTLAIAFFDEDGLPKDMTGAVLRGQIRKNALDTGTPLITIAFEWIDITEGTAESLVTANQTTVLDVGELRSDNESLHWYDMELVLDGVTYRLLEGQCTIYREVTK